MLDEYRAIAFHRGNTYYGYQNSLETLVGEFLNLRNRDIMRLPKGINLNKVYEIDIILEPPYLAMHDTDIMVGDRFRFTQTAELQLSLEQQNTILQKLIYELTEEEVRYLLYKTGDTPIILRDILEIAKLLQFKLYLDIKVPNNSKPSDKNTGYLEERVSDVLNIIQNADALETIDTIISFDDGVSTSLRKEIDIRSLNINLGMFVTSVYDDVRRNREHLDELALIIKPRIISYKYEVVSEDPLYLTYYDKMEPIKKYVWTLHIDDVEADKEDNPTLFVEFQKNGVSLVIDTFERVGDAPR